MQFTINNKQCKLSLKPTLAVLLLGLSSISYANETDDKTDLVLKFHEGFSVDFQTAKIKDVFDGNGVGINYQASLSELSEDQLNGKADLYGRLQHQINEEGSKSNLTQTEITLGVNWAYSDKTHFYIESALMKQQLEVNNRVGSQTFNITRLGGKYNFYKDFVVNAALEHRDALKNETGYKLALETTKAKYALFSAGYLSVGNNQSMFFTLISKF
ncbi:hypothetical protein C7Y70_14565 [Pseudoalteromonas sp. KS88]|uniref:hypothetical protein n=1 Tax=Pseudoalteromonas sp. KS88 TaxID=2109918 RepID=UPI0010806A20|nr:hypothetical protein [Pseudoalteromonas sp. KS88]TGE81119.1 hypothetical protein C7Y70_14565 [Pseudoalteromonas sp. KS88]